MYQALYRKWRPKSFSDVVGQNHITETLKREIDSGRISHAYLFTGSRGTGKTTCAKIFAKSVNCKNVVSGEACRQCEICKEAESESLLDIVEIDAASNNSVENIRTMKEELVFSPVKCKYRVYIVDEVHMLSTGAFNAFLKILEEPPPHVIFILATTEVQKIPATILSRCQRFDFYRISSDDIFKRLKYICNEEKISIEDEALKLISSSADGAMRDALSILDQCCNLSKDDITAASVKKILGISGNEYITEFIDFICNKDGKSCLNLVNDLYIQSKNFSKLCEELLNYYRDIMVYKVTNSGSEKIKDSASKLNMQDILNSMDILQESLKNMSNGANNKIELELALVKLCVQGENISNDAKPKIKIPKKAEVENEPNPPKDKISLGILNAPVQENEFEPWDKILENLKEKPELKSLYIALKDSKAHENKNYILIESKRAVAFELLRNANYRNSIKNIVREITGKYYNLGPYTPPADEGNDLLNKIVEKAQKNNIKLEENI